MTLFLKVKTFQGLHAIVYTFSHTFDYNINVCLLYESMYVLAGWKRISSHKIFHVKVKSEIQNISGTKQLTNILFDILIVTQMQKKNQIKQPMTNEKPLDFCIEVKCYEFNSR